MSSTIISVEEVSYRYQKDREVLHDLSFSISQGEFFSLLGPNGAGKSTCIHILSTLLPLQQGNITIHQLDLRKEARTIKKHIGVVPQEIALYEDLSGLENLIFWGGLYKIPQQTLKERAQHLLQQFGLSDRANDKLKTYSGGMKRRINIASALMHDPDIVYMDEPTVGIDPQSRNNIYEFMADLKRKGKTILYTTHYMEEAERFSDRIGIIENGSMLAMGTLPELLQKSPVQQQVHVALDPCEEKVKSDLNIKLQRFQPLWQEFTCTLHTADPQNDFKSILNTFIDANCSIRNVDKQGADLEGLFLHLTGKSLRD